MLPDENLKNAPSSNSNHDAAIGDHCLSFPFYTAHPIARMSTFLNIAER
uniref:Uncharacterized protein n=1 Tax=Rhizophora mucronata TaxID=61149 RepID=A0A2P2PQU2_RHIMU